MTARQARADEIVAAITTEAAGHPVPLVATLDPRSAAAHAMRGVAVLVAPPIVSFNLAPPATTCTWQLYVLAGGTDPLASWRAVDAALDVVRVALPGLDDARPADWQLPTGDQGQAPLVAYLTTWTDSV